MTVRGSALALLGALGFTGGALAISACSLLFDAGSLSQGSTTSDGGRDAGGGGRDAGGGDSGGGAPCPGTAGPVAVRVGNGADVSFCIDATEVTRDLYGSFLASKQGDTRGQPQGCEFNATYEPELEDGGAVPSGTPGDMPVTYVDWCDAYAYCAWAGKRLCGRIGGGPASLATPGDATDSQWMFACSRGGTRAYPYAATFDTNACNDGEGGGNIAPVKKFPRCSGGFDGVFDMSGNVEEWEDACDVNGYCLTRGGSAFDGRDPSRDVFSCAIPYRNDGETRTARYEDIGFRCCGD